MTHQTRDRRSEATREQILAAAIAIAQEEGWPAVTMRKIAGRIDYSHAALYAYFANKDDLLLALLRKGLAMYRDELESAASTAPSLEDAALAQARVLWAFPSQHPELYQVMHGLGGVAFGTADTRAEGRASVAPALAVVTQLVTRHGGTAEAAQRLCTMIWCTIHGIVTLTMAGRFTPEEGAALAELAAQDALARAIAPAAPAGEDEAPST